MSKNTEQKPCRSCYREGCGCDFIDGECWSTDKPEYAPSPSEFVKENKKLREKIQELKDKVEKLNKDNFALSAGCCEYLIGDERGHETCKFREKLKELGERE